MLGISLSMPQAFAVAVNHPFPSLQQGSSQRGMLLLGLSFTQAEHPRIYVPTSWPLSFHQGQPLNVGCSLSGD